MKTHGGNLTCVTLLQAEFIHWPVHPVLHSGQFRKYCELGKDRM